MRLRGLNTSGIYAFNRVMANVNQLHVVAVEGFKIMAVDGRAFGCKRVVNVREQCSHCRVLHHLPNFVFDERCSCVVGRFVTQQIVERGAKLQTTLVPCCLVNGLAFFIADFKCGSLFNAKTMRVWRLLHQGTNLIGILFDMPLEVVTQGGISGGNAVVGGALKHRQMGRLLGNHRNGLYAC